MLERIMNIQTNLDFDQIVWEENEYQWLFALVWVICVDISRWTKDKVSQEKVDS